MAETKYQVLYRYVNPNSNQLVTNDDNKYNNVFEFYHDKHKISIGTQAEQLIASKEKSELITEGNSTANDNYSMLFKFTGTKRINKREWVPKSMGYVIRNKDAIRDLITRAVDGDYSGQYLLIEGDSIENGIVVAKTNPVSTNISVEQIDSANKLFFKDDDELKNAIINKTIAQLNTTVIDDFSSLSRYIPYTPTGQTPTPGGVYNINIKLGYDFAVGSINYRTGISSYATVKKALQEAAYNNVVASGGQGFTSVTITPSHVQTYEIPAHYEEVADYPYVLVDTYEKIEQSPWFVLSSHGSLSSALEKIKAIVKTVGVDNVKLIKIVPTDQFVKIN